MPPNRRSPITGVRTIEMMRGRDTIDVDPACDNRELLRLDIYPAIDPWRLHKFFIRQHLRHRFIPLGLSNFWLINCWLNFMDLMDLMVSTCRCCIPAMIRAMPINVHRAKMLTRFSLAHARL